MKALLLDYNGVIVNDERIHFDSFREVLADDGIEITEQEYDATYLGLDDRAAFRKVMDRHGKRMDAATLEQRIQRKSRVYLARAKDEIQVVPGIAAFVRDAARDARIAVVSGALGTEIPLGLERAGIAGLVEALVCSGDVQATKPDPAGFRLGLERLSAKHGVREWSVVVVEDSLPGVAAAHALGAGCVAITTSHPADALGDADVTWTSFEGHDVSELEPLWRPVTL